MAFRNAACLRSDSPRRFVFFLWPDRARGRFAGHTKRAAARLFFVRRFLRINARSLPAPAPAPLPAPAPAPAPRACACARARAPRPRLCPMPAPAPVPVPAPARARARARAPRPRPRPRTRARPRLRLRPMPKPCRPRAISRPPALPRRAGQRRGAELLDARRRVRPKNFLFTSGGRLHRSLSAFIFQGALRRRADQ